MELCICCRIRSTLHTISRRHFCTVCLDAWRGAGGTYDHLADELLRVLAPLPTPTAAFTL